MAASTPDRTSDASQACLNCATPLAGNFCSNCGQRARVPALSFWQVMTELVEEAFDLDSKAWRSLVPLLFRPGLITADYFAGRRARYITPLRLYLTASVLFFIVAAITDQGLRVSWGDPATERERIEAAGQTEDTNIIIAQEGGCEAILRGDSARWSEFWRERGYEACRKVTADSGESLERAAVDNIPIMMVFFIPVLALVMKLLYPLSKRYYVEHLVFFVHYHAFGFFVLTVLLIVYKLGALVEWNATAWRVISMIVSGYIALYLLIAMRRVYQQGWLATSLKYFVLYLAYVTGLSLSLFGVVLYTAMNL
ncbi:MAG: DUF3667 domain-containing protein [Gammaproteobacteria bacterium]